MIVKSMDDNICMRSPEKPKEPTCQKKRVTFVDNMVDEEEDRGEPIYILELKENTEGLEENTGDSPVSELKEFDELRENGQNSTVGKEITSDNDEVDADGNEANCEIELTGQSDTEYWAPDFGRRSPLNCGR